ncbi:hypothetical protein RE6C_05013 [Rhodopirellula europaea 6C]|uniref:Uncharacterized protein n=1 Tax=Rhodopirellula europaea 6C TaxID=1263867 RepID=M2ANF1_9BACT|nr:hypothetical protein RE6C_05013 [Rhodopirellula europaea 6C]
MNQPSTSHHINWPNSLWWKSCRAFIVSGTIVDRIDLATSQGSPCLTTVGRNIGWV